MKMSDQAAEPSVIICCIPLHFQNKCPPDTWTNGASFTRVATALSESSSIHSDALYHVARDMSGTGQDPVSYSILETEPHTEEPWAEESQSLLQVIKPDQRKCVCVCEYKTNYAFFLFWEPV